MADSPSDQAPSAAKSPSAGGSGSRPSPVILMCPPDYYGIEYEINPWMSRSRQSDPERSRQQWAALQALLQQLGAEIRLLEPVRGLPDLVFTANAALVVRNTIYLARFRYPARQPETAVDELWFREQGFDCITLPDRWSFEGAGDALFCGDTLFGGYVIRSDAGALHWLGGQIGCRTLPLQLVDQYYYHLDTCFCPLSDTEALYFPPAFDEYAQRSLAEAIPGLIAIAPEEAQRFACNAVVVGRHVVINTGCPRLEIDLRAHGYTPHSTELDEFIKAGGSAKCLTLRLDGEEAARWP
jgi:N-dimethylarginine dimethylaminohydrolase